MKAVVDLAADAIAADAVVKPRGGGARANVWRHHLMLLSVMVLVGFAVRATALAVWRTGAISSEGAEYARIAENMRNGVGYVGIATPGPEVMFPPLFPLLIGVASLVTHNYEWAGRLVSLVLGTCLPLPVFGIALRLFGHRPALVAAALATLHPLLINLSVAVFSEGPYITLLLSAVCLVLRALDHPSVKLWSFVGGAFGAAYLIRQEAVAPLLIALAFVLTSTNDSLGTNCKRAVAALAVFGMFALPEVIFLYRSTGKVRFEEKSAINFAIGIRMLAEQANSEAGRLAAVVPPETAVDPEKIAEYAIDADLKRSGVWLRRNAEVVRELHVTPREFASFLKEAMRRNIPILLDQSGAKWLGAPFLPGLALLGAFRRPWRRPIACCRLFVMLVPATAIMATFSVIHGLSPRNYFVLVPFLMIWGANGFVEMIRWTKVSVVAVGQWLSPRLAEVMVSALLALALIVLPLRSVRHITEFEREGPATSAIKHAGLWVKQQQTRAVTIIDTTTPLAFHAGAQYVHFPYCGAELALRFLDASKVDYVVLRRGEKFTDYYEDWLKRGIPDSRAELVYASSGENTDKVMVYRWHRPDSHLAAKPKTVLGRYARENEGFALVFAASNSVLAKNLVIE